MKRITLENDYYSDFENENNTIERYELDIEEFYSYYSDDIIDIYEEFKEKFSCSPFFLSYLTYPLLTDFLLSFVLSKPKLGNVSNKNDYLYDFNNFYKVEIESSYNIICTFLRKFKKNLLYDTYVDFCFKLTDLHELKHNI
jgi:hypothetical protein